MKLDISCEGWLFLSSWNNNEENTSQLIWEKISDLGLEFFFSYYGDSMSSCAQRRVEQEGVRFKQSDDSSNSVRQVECNEFSNLYWSNVYQSSKHTRMKFVGMITIATIKKCQSDGNCVHVRRKRIFFARYLWEWTAEMVPTLSSSPSAETINFSFILMIWSHDISKIIDFILFPLQILVYFTDSRLFYRL